MIEARAVPAVPLAASFVVAAEPGTAAQSRAADYATCAAFYCNAVNVKPVAEYETVYGAGERAFNAGLELIGR